MLAWVHLMSAVVKPTEVAYTGPRNPAGAFFSKPFCLDLYAPSPPDRPPVTKVAFDTALAVEGFRIDVAAAERAGRFPHVLGGLYNTTLTLRQRNTTWPPPPPHGSSTDLRLALDQCVHGPEGRCKGGPAARLLTRPEQYQARVVKATKARRKEAGEHSRGESWQAKGVTRGKKEASSRGSWPLKKEQDTQFGILPSVPRFNGSMCAFSCLMPCVCLRRLRVCWFVGSLAATGSIFRLGVGLGGSGPAQPLGAWAAGGSRRGRGRETARRVRHGLEGRRHKNAD